jgi:hypothetical protein
MALKFGAQVNAWARKSERRLEAIFKESAQRVIEQAQKVGPSVANPGGGEGGLMPVDTNFLRASGQASLTGWPSGPSRQDESPGQFDYSITIAGARIGQTIYFGWTAEYARYMEQRYSFMRSAAQNWGSIVNSVTREAQVRFP